jgi:hypothetical protein
LKHRAIAKQLMQGKQINKKGDQMAAFFEILLPALLRAGGCIVVITGGNNDTSDDSSRSNNSNDNAAATTELAFFLLSNRGTLYRGFRSSCRLSNNGRADERRSCQGNERNFTETHFLAPFLSCGFKHTDCALA